LLEDGTRAKEGNASSRGFNGADGGGAGYGPQ
jgi:hypothetical protein